MTTLQNLTRRESYSPSKGVAINTRGRETDVIVWSLKVHEQLGRSLLRPKGRGDKLNKVSREISCALIAMLRVRLTKSPQRRADDTPRAQVNRRRRRYFLRQAEGDMEESAASSPEKQKSADRGSVGRHMTSHDTNTIAARGKSSERRGSAFHIIHSDNTNNYNISSATASYWHIRFTQFN